MDTHTPQQRLSLCIFCTGQLLPLTEPADGQSHEPGTDAAASGAPIGPGGRDISSAPPVSLHQHHNPATPCLDRLSPPSLRSQEPSELSLLSSFRSSQLRAEPLCDLGAEQRGWGRRRGKKKGKKKQQQQQQGAPLKIQGAPPHPKRASRTSWHPLG